jgi:ssDNA-binding Zn-finger/Zn-ribbon topoisomerase 1
MSAACQDQPCIVCPHCGFRFMESSEFDDVGAMDCPQCEKPFSYSRTVLYSTEPTS